MDVASVPDDFDFAITTVDGGQVDCNGIFWSSETELELNCPYSVGFSNPVNIEYIKGATPLIRLYDGSEYPSWPILSSPVT